MLQVPLAIIEVDAPQPIQKKPPSQVKGKGWMASSPGVVMKETQTKPKATSWYKSRSKRAAPP